MVETPKTPPKFFSWCGPDEDDPRYVIIGICMARETAAALRCDRVTVENESLSLQVDITDHLKYLAGRLPGKAVKLVLTIADDYEAQHAAAHAATSDLATTVLTKTKEVLH